MSKGLKKIQKKIACKKGKTSALHENSRDAQRLKRAQGRDEKLERVALARRKNERPLLERTAYFQKPIKLNGGKVLGMEEIQTLIKSFLNQHIEELSLLKKQRRPGRPPSTREDLVRMKVARDDKEYRDGFYMPDLTDENNVTYFSLWEGNWSYLSTLKWVRVSSDGNVQMSRFPPNREI
ncbi:hypothetical protein Golomagni_03372 [Golovinomyces magnicellulatus]|nr:hypothetical protein Golomagni_03372 [Golovinomyces magnicellulatus]